MNKQEAIEALLQGKKLTHDYFSDDEYITMPNPYTMRMEDGAEIDADTFWSDRPHPNWDEGWNIYEKQWPLH